MSPIYHHPFIQQNCVCTSCCQKRQTLWEAAQARRNGEEISLEQKKLAEQVFFGPSPGPVERKLAETALYYIEKPKRVRATPIEGKKRVARDCENCGKTISVRKCDVNRGWGRFCSLACRADKMITKHADAKEARHA